MALSPVRLPLLLRLVAVAASCALTSAAAAAVDPRAPTPPPTPPTFAVSSWYGPGFHGRPRADGGRFDQWGDACAHRTLPFGTVLRLRNLRNGAQATCVVRDRGPFIRGRVLDVSRGTARALRMEAAGLAPLSIEIVERAGGPA